MKNVTIHEARTNLPRLILQAAAGEDVVISRGPKPVARLMAIGEVKGKRKPGALKGVLHVGASSARERGSKNSGPTCRTP